MPTYLQEAFNQICKESVKPQGFYVSLMENVPFYGGPEEGGWWGHDTRIVAYQRFPSLEQAEIAKVQVEAYAVEINSQALKEYGNQCIRETEWLEARGLDDSFFPEPDGESHFYVVVSEGLPEETTGDRHYE
jgi:hypothetical protein